MMTCTPTVGYRQSPSDSMNTNLAPWSFSCRRFAIGHAQPPRWDRERDRYRNTNLNLSAGANFNTTANDCNGKIRVSDFQNALSSVVSGSLAPSSSAQLNVKLDASFLDTDLSWSATGAYNLNAGDTGWSDGSFNFNFPDPKTLLGSIGENFF